MSESVPDFGCTDAACVFHFPSHAGPSTNGGCTCLREALPMAKWEERADLHQQIKMALKFAYERGYSAGMK